MVAAEGALDAEQRIPFLFGTGLWIDGQLDVAEDIVAAAAGMFVDQFQRGLLDFRGRRRAIPLGERQQAGQVPGSTRRPLGPHLHSADLKTTELWGLGHEVRKAGVALRQHFADLQQDFSSLVCRLGDDEAADFDSLPLHAAGGFDLHVESRIVLPQFRLNAGPNSLVQSFTDHIFRSDHASGHQERNRGQARDGALQANGKAGFDGRHEVGLLGIFSPIAGMKLVRTPVARTISTNMAGWR